MKKTSIIFVVGNLDMGGAENSLLRLCRALNPEEYELTVLSIFGREGVLSDSFPKYVRIQYINRNRSLSFRKKYSRIWNKIYELQSKKLWGEKRAKNIIIRKLLKKIAAIEYNCFISYISSQLSNRSYDISVGCMEKDPSVVATHCINAMKKYIFYAHGSVEEYYKDYDSYIRCDKIIAKSERIKEEIIKVKKYNREKIIVLYNIYDISDIRNRSHENVYYDKNKLNLVTVGRFHEDKGQECAINAAKILKEIGLNFKWTFVGNDITDYGNKCHLQVEKLSLKDSIVFVGTQKNPYPFISFADIYVLPSKCEALPGSLVEALILKKPIISTNTLGAQELIINNYNGIICTYEAEDLANTIFRLANNEKQMRTLIDNTAESIGRFEREIDKYELLFQDV